MASYNDDSSSDDELDIQTNVTLGYATDTSTGDDISHAGGHPTWLDPQTKPAASLARCKICNNYMSLLLQLQADLQQHFPDDERRLSIWYCRRKQCSKKVGGIRVFREVKKAKTTRQPQLSLREAQPSAPQSPLNLGNQLFGSSSTSASTNLNPFAISGTSNTSASHNANPFSTSSSTFNTAVLQDELAAKPPQPPTQSFADKLKISAPSDLEMQSKSSAPVSEPWPSENDFPPPLPHFYLDAEAEYLDPSPTSGPSVPGSSNSRGIELDDEPSSTTSAAAEKDLYESPHDRTFDHFTRILSQNPEQILRYEFKGVPLLYSSTDAVALHFVLPGHMLHAQNQKVKTSGPVKGIPSCQDCGAARVFELQLVPYLIFELEKDNEEALKIDGEEGMEWGTIIVGTCSKNCGDEQDRKVVFREEWVGVQWEDGGVELKQKKR